MTRQPALQNSNNLTEIKISPLVNYVPATNSNCLQIQILTKLVNVIGYFRHKTNSLIFQ